MNSSNGNTPHPNPQPTFIRFENVTKTFQEGEKERAVLQGVNAEIARGEFVVIVGRSGSGKSTLLNLLAGLDTPTQGDIWIGETNIAKCVVCLQIMDKRDSGNVPIYELIQRPEDA